MECQMDGGGNSGPGQGREGGWKPGTWGWTTNDKGVSWRELRKECYLVFHAIQGHLAQVVTSQYLIRFIC